MLSICIPVYNFDVRTLVRELHAQGLQSGVQFEILVFDDFSDEQYKNLNRELTALNNVFYKELEQNTGRSRIRNMLASQARFPHLLFVDCDMRLGDNPDFIQNYLTKLSFFDVLCGGHVYQVDPPLQPFLLHWKYGKTREVKNADIRNLNSGHAFMTANFVISKNIFDKIRFDEKLTTYGHEDTLFGYELLRLKKNILHIDNPLVHIGLHQTEVFLEKTKASVLNLLKIFPQIEQNKDFAGHIRLLKTFLQIKRAGLIKATATFFRLFRSIMERNLHSAQPSLLVLDVYKLGYMCEKSIEGN